MEASYYSRAAICKRGHVETSYAEGRRELPSRCEKCGAAVLVACPSCGERIRGDLNVPGVINLVDDYKRPQFCDKCGGPFPWLDRQGRIYLLENMLDEEDLDPATNLEVREQLQALAELEPGDEDERRRWEKVKGLAPGLWDKSGGRAILETVISAAIKSQLGL